MARLPLTPAAVEASGSIPAAVRQPLSGPPVVLGSERAKRMPLHPPPRRQESRGFSRARSVPWCVNSRSTQSRRIAAASEWTGVALRSGARSCRPCQLARGARRHVPRERGGTLVGAVGMFALTSSRVRRLRPRDSIASRTPRRSRIPREVVPGLPRGRSVIDRHPALGIVAVERRRCVRSNSLCAAFTSGSIPHCRGPVAVWTATSDRRRRTLRMPAPMACSMSDRSAGWPRNRGRR